MTNSESLALWEHQGGSAYQLPAPVQRTVPVILRTFPAYVRASPALLSRDGLRIGVHYVTNPGGGKSRSLGRGHMWQDALDGIPIVALDKAGGTIDNFLDKVLRCPSQALRSHILSRITYIDLGATDFIVPLPFYFRMSAGDTLSLIASRPIEVIKRADPALVSASIMGFNALDSLAHPAGVVTATLGLQISDAIDLVCHPDRWKPRLQAAAQLHPEAAWAVASLQGYARLPESQRSRQAGSFLAKMQPFERDSQLRAMFSAHRWGFHFAQVDQPGQITLIDGRNVRNRSAGRFSMLWIFTNLLEYFNLRGTAGHDNPLSFYIDELSSILGYGTQHEQSVLAEDIEELCSVIGRGMGVNVVISHQSMTQMDERIQNVLMQMGTQLVGRVQNPHDADLLAAFLFRYDAYAVKRTQPVWMSVQQSTGPFSYSEPEIIDRTEEYFSPEEQRIAGSQLIQTLPKFEFLARVASDEGTVSPTLRRLSIAGLDPGLYPNQVMLEETRRLLRQRDGYAMADLLAEIDRRRQDVIHLVQPHKKRRKKPKTSDAILEKDTKNVQESSKPDRVPENPALPAGNARPEAQAEDEDWRKRFWTQRQEATPASRQAG